MKHMKRWTYILYENHQGMKVHGCLWTGGQGGWETSSLLAKISTPLSRKITSTHSLEWAWYPHSFFLPGQNFHNNTMLNPPDGLILGFAYTICKKNCLRRSYNLLSHRGPFYLWTIHLWESSNRGFQLYGRNLRSLGPLSTTLVNLANLVTLGGISTCYR